MAGTGSIDREKIVNISKKRIDELLGVHKNFHTNCIYLAKKQPKWLERKHAGKVLVIVDEEIIRSFDRDEFEENFKKLEDELGKDKLRSACVTYIPKPKEVLMF